MILKNISLKLRIWNRIYYSLDQIDQYFDVFPGKVRDDLNATQYIACTRHIFLYGIHTLISFSAEQIQLQATQYALFEMLFSATIIVQNLSTLIHKGCVIWPSIQCLTTNSQQGVSTSQDCP